MIDAMYYLSKEFNNVINTKQSIITAANSYKIIKETIKEMEEKAWKEVNSKKTTEFHFDPNEIEPIVLKTKENKIIANDKFKEKLKVKEIEKLEDKKKIIPIKKKEQYTEEKVIG